MGKSFFVFTFENNVPRLVIDVISLSAVEIVVDKPDAVVEIVDDITLNGLELLNQNTGSENRVP